MIYLCSGYVLFIYYWLHNLELYLSTVWTLTIYGKYYFHTILCAIYNNLDIFYNALYNAVGYYPDLQFFLYYSHKHILIIGFL